VYWGRNGFIKLSLERQRQRRQSASQSKDRPRPHPQTQAAAEAEDCGEADVVQVLGQKIEPGAGGQEEEEGDA
jgi:hypothetical protein